MGKIILLNKVFNHDRDVKEAFLKDIKPSTAKTIRSILFKVDEYEEVIGKSIYDFSLEDRDDFLVSMFKNNSKCVINTTRSYLVKYINYCIDNDIWNNIRINDSILNKTSRKELYKLFLNEEV